MFEQQHLRKDGTVFPSLIDMTTFQDGRRGFWAGYCSDITERKRFEEMRSRRARSASEHSPARSRS